MVGDDHGEPVGRALDDLRRRAANGRGGRGGQRALSQAPLQHPPPPQLPIKTLWTLSHLIVQLGVPNVAGHCVPARLPAAVARDVDVDVAVRALGAAVIDPACSEKRGRARGWVGGRAGSRNRRSHAPPALTPAAPTRPPPRPIKASGSRRNDRLSQRKGSSTQTHAHHGTTCRWQGGWCPGPRPGPGT